MHPLHGQRPPTPPVRVLTVPQKTHESSGSPYRELNPRNKYGVAIIEKVRVLLLLVAR